jgi:hypothetical protein
MERKKMEVLFRESENIFGKTKHLGSVVAGE